jgi:uncharacterized membrane protein YjgN (DUF898 family)
MELAATAVDGAVPAARGTIPFKFTATGAEYFRIWIVNLLLTLVTLGIYSAWAKVRRLRYFYGNTSVADSAFEYHGQPIQILKGRLIAAAALIVYSATTHFWPLSIFVFAPLLAFAIPWVIVRSRKFQMQVTSWRNLRFRFHGTYGGAFAAYIGWAIVAVITLYIMLPHLLYKRVKFLLSETSFGGQRLRFEKTVGPYYKLYYVTLLIGLGMMVAAVIVMAVIGGIIGGISGLSGMAGPSPKSVGSVLLSLVMSGVFALLFLPIVAMFERKFLNENFDGLRIGPHTVRCRLETGRLAQIYITNLLGMIFTLGLFYPWARVRRMQYQFESMSLETVGSLDGFVADADKAQSATGEELGEFFDVDFGF